MGVDCHRYMALQGTTINPQPEGGDMTSMLRRVLVLAMAGALTVSALHAQGRRRAAGSEPKTPSPAVYQTDQLEHYLTDDGIAYIRPGLKIKVNSITIGANRVPVIDLTITDNFDQPLDRLGKVTPGAISISFILAKFNPETRLYESYTTRTATAGATSPKQGTAIQASADSGGTWTDLSIGQAKYTFKTALPANFEVGKTHTLGIYSTRNLTEQLGKNYYANVEHDFRPDGAAVVAAQSWDKVRDANSCLNCHTELALHGGSRRDVKLCVLCHNPGTTDPDTGSSVDMATMTHKIHSGHNLKNGYTVIGNGGVVHDFSHVTYPQDRRNCWNCHEGTGAASTKPTQADAWLTKPSARACGACHDDVNFATGENHGHPGANIPPQKDDSQCARCHIPDSGVEFDASIKGAHTIPEKSRQLKGLKSEIVSFSDMVAGKKPTVVFKITNADGSAVDGSKLATFAPILAGPTTSYTKYFRESGVGTTATAAKFDAATGLTTYTFTNAIPADTKGTWTLSADVYRNATIKRTDGLADITVREAAYNPIKYVAVVGTSVTPRRTIVTDAQCNACHDRLALHGGQRLVISECVICHNPTMTDSARRVANAGAPEAISFQYMVHRIHTGHELENDFTVYGNGNTAHNYNEVTYPGNRAVCADCHTGGSQRLPLPASAGAVTTPRDYYTPMGPAAAACLSCHDSKDAAAHAFLNTTMFGGTTQAEACGACHGEGSEWAVDKVHAQ
jgi:OmcA/MtrC family decaheme c-type cytochrome